VGKKAGYINKEGQIVIPARYLWARNFGDGLARVGVTGGVDYIDETGRSVIRLKKATQAGTRGFRKGIAALQVGTKWGFIDKTGKTVIPANYEMVGDFFEGRAAVTLGAPSSSASKKGSTSAAPVPKWGYIDTTGRMVIKPAFEIFTLQAGTTTGDFHDGLAAVKSKNKWGYIDKSGKAVIPFKYNYAAPFSEGLALVLPEPPDGGKGGIGYIDKTGKLVVEPRFAKGGSFKSAFAPVKEGDKYGFIDRGGRMVIPARFEGAADFSEALAAVKVDGRWGYVDTEGDVVIDPQFDEALPFDGGLAPVALRGKEGYVDKTGNLVWPQGQ